MAIDQIPYQEADNLAYAEKSFYPVRIPVSHWQLRHYISNPEPGLLYYASGHDIYCLHTTSKKRKHIATLPFEARCTASGYGWVCVGGEDEGYFAAIKLDGSGPRTTEVDSALPLDGRIPGASGTGRRAASVKVERIGEEIVNSVSIHRIQDEDAHLDDIVAVLTNNDRTVRIYSLPQNLETTVLDLPFAMNHATVSPDGQMLVAVGDHNQAYFFSREVKGEVPQIPKPHNRLTSSSIKWTLSSVVDLHVSSPEITFGYFTTAWSPSGQLVAVGSEGGYITVFDVERLCDPELEDDDAIVAVIPSSRADLPPPHPGAVRTLLFSPDPWDLLVWSEDQGRICIGDLRTGLNSRQVIALEPKDESLKALEYEELPSESDTLGLEQHASRRSSSRSLNDMEADFVRRYQQAPDNATAVNFATEYIEARRRQRQARQDMVNLRSQTNTPSSRLPSTLEDDPQGLTAHEQQILESLRTTRQREEARQLGQIPRTVNYTGPEMFAHSASSGSRSSAANTPSTGASSARPLSDILSSMRDELPALSRTSAASPRPSSSHANDHDGNVLPPLRNIDHPTSSTASLGYYRLGDGSRLPRRRQSIMIAPPTTQPSSSAAAPSHSTDSGVRTLPTVSAADDDANPWRTIEDAMSLARGPLFESATRVPPSGSPLPAAATAAAAGVSEQELQAELASERARARSLARQSERWRTRLAADSQAQPSASATATGQAELRRLAAFPDGYDTLLRRQHLRTGANGREIGTRTAGLAMSADGRTLWAACEDGIFEISLNLKGRMFWPSVEPR